MEKYFTGPTAAAISSDAISTAKILTKFSKSNNKLKIVADSWMVKFWMKRGVYYSHTTIIRGSKAKIVGILASPAQKLVSILLAPGSKITISAQRV